VFWFLDPVVLLHPVLLKYQEANIFVSIPKIISNRHMTFFSNPFSPNCNCLSIPVCSYSFLLVAKTPDALSTLAYLDTAIAHASPSRDKGKVVEST